MKTIQIKKHFEAYLFLQKHVPPCLRICSTFITQMGFVGGTGDSGEIPKHKDKQDLRSAIITLGDESIVGGHKMYFNDLICRKSSNITHTTYFQHGQVQIGFFNDVYHAATPLTNISRITINLNLKVNVQKNFITRGHDKYETYKNTGYEKIM